MIKSQLGTVFLSKPNYELAKQLEVSPSDADIAIKSILRADLIAILNAFVLRYGLNEALDLWYDVVEAYVKKSERRITV